LGQRHWRGPELIAGVRAALLDTGLDAHTLRLEAPADAVLAEDEEVTDTLEVLAEIGVQVVVAGVHPGGADGPPPEQAAVHGWKVTGVRAPGEPSEGTTATDDRALADLVRLAHKTDRVVIVDGVATEEQAARLREIGVDLGQGPFYGEPALAADIEPRLANR
jgi:EAL domain-containing protein (putative c-di-GMP-specific phosphodiesterase class I)